MNYLDQRAHAIYHYDKPKEPPTDDEMVLYRAYALLSFAKGTATTPKDVHDAWALWRSGNHPEHPDLVPFEELSTAKQERDNGYCQAIVMCSDDVWPTTQNRRRR